MKKFREYLQIITLIMAIIVGIYKAMECGSPFNPTDDVTQAELVEQVQGMIAKMYGPVSR